MHRLLAAFPIIAGMIGPPDPCRAEDRRDASASSHREGTNLTFDERIANRPGANSILVPAPLPHRLPVDDLPSSPLYDPASGATISDFGSVYADAAPILTLGRAAPGQSINPAGNWAHH